MTQYIDKQKQRNKKQLHQEIDPTAEQINFTTYLNTKTKQPQTSTHEKMPLFYTILASCLGFLEIKDSLTVWFDAGQNDYLDYKNTSGGSYGSLNGQFGTGHHGGGGGSFHNFNSYKRASPEMKATLEFYVQYIALLKFILGIVLLITALVLPTTSTTFTSSTSSSSGSVNSNNIYAIIYSNYLRGMLSLGISIGYLFHLYHLQHSLNVLVVTYKQLPEGLDVAMDFIHVCVIAPLFLVASFLQFRSVYKLKSYITANKSSYSNGNGYTNGHTNGVTNGHSKHE